MRLRKQSATGDMVFGLSMGDFWHDEVDGVGQAILTRLLLYRGEWFLDRKEGTPWGAIPFNQFVLDQGEVLGNHTAEMRDWAIRERVLRTPGVGGIVSYTSNTDPITRRFSVEMVVETIYGRLALRGANDSFTVSPAQVALPSSRRQRLAAPPRQLAAPQPRMG
jgi:hypothetical protein